MGREIRIRSRYIIIVVTQDFFSLVKNKFQKSASFSCLLYHKKQGGHEKSAPGHRGFPRKYRTVDTTNFSSESGNWQ